MHHCMLLYAIMHHCTSLYAIVHHYASLYVKFWLDGSEFFFINLAILENLLYSKIRRFSRSTKIFYVNPLSITKIYTSQKPLISLLIFYCLKTFN